MSKPTFERLNYVLRPAKNVERKMICEALVRLSALDRLKRYRYIGFGAVAFYDFVLFHQRLGIHDMVSIEKEDDAKRRFEENRPYSCIKILWGKSDSVLPTLDFERKRNIVWLDYDDHLDATSIADTSCIAASIRSGSVLIVTVCADTGDASVDAPTKRLESLRSKVGNTLIRPEVKAGDLSDWGYAKVCRDILSDLIEKKLSDRNAPLPASEKIQFMQLFNFIYQDGTRMMTFGGLFLNRKDAAVLPSRHFQDLEFVQTAEEQFKIETPILTLREIRYLDSLLPKVGVSGKTPSWIPQGERAKYKRIYRYFPTFSEVEN